MNFSSFRVKCVREEFNVHLHKEKIYANRQADMSTSHQKHIQMRSPPKEELAEKEEVFFHHEDDSSSSLKYVNRK